MFGLEFLILGVIIFFVVRAISKRRAITGESAAKVVRHLFQYLALLLTLGLTAFGVAGLLEVIFTSAGAVTRDTALIARSVAFLVVGGPAFTALALYTRRQMRIDPAESQSLGWMLYLTIATLGSLVGVIVSGSILLANLMRGDGFATAAFIHFVVWAAVWIVHWIISTRVQDQERLQPGRLLGSLAGLAVILTTGSITLGMLLEEMYDQVADTAVADTGWDRLADPLSALIFGTMAWSWYWLHASRGDERTPLWTSYVLLAGVLIGVLMTVGGTAGGLFLVFDWLFSAPAESAASFFESLPATMGVALVGATSWLYHRVVLRTDIATRSEVHCAYDCSLSGIGVVVSAIAVGTFVATGMRALADIEVTDTVPTALAAAATLLVVGVPLWLRHWVRLQRELQTDPEAFTPSLSRRIYLPAVSGLGALTALVGLIVTVYAAVQNILDQHSLGVIVHEVAIPFAFTVTGAAVAAYHVWVLSKDRGILSAVTPRVRVREVILVSQNGAALAGAISDAHVRVHRMHAAAPLTVAPSIGDVMDTLESETHERLLVVATEDKYEIVPID